MEREIEIKLNAIEQHIAKHKAECRKNVFEALNILLNEYPEHKEEIQAKFNGICRQYGIDFYSEMRVNDSDIVQYVEQNVKTIE